MSLRVCHNVFVPLRESPAHRSQMTSQLLFGERFGIVDSAAGWLKIVSFFDSYTGWIDGSQVLSREWDASQKGIITCKETRWRKPDNSVEVLMPGSEIFNFELSTGIITIEDEEWQLIDAPFEQALLPAGDIIQTALMFLNVPYLWGGRTPGGIDCSGLVQTVCKIHGIKLPRDAGEQAGKGETVNFIEEAMPGDLLFFSGETDNISHVAMFIEHGKVIHASGTVKIESVDHQGIWSNDKGKYTHYLRTIKRVL